MSKDRTSQEIEFSAGDIPLASVDLGNKLVHHADIPADIQKALGEMVVESVILGDDRTTELYTRNVPERLVCALTIHAGGKTFHGTGWLAGPAIVMTCGHNVHHPDFGGWAAQIEVAPGRSENDQPFGKAIATRFSAHDRWVAGHDADFDVACLHLDAPLGNDLGWFDVKKVETAHALVGQTIVCSGYPEYQGEFTRQRRGEGQAVATTQTRLYHTIDTNDGDSGGPIWVQDGGDNPPSAVAIHTYEKIVLAGPPRQEANSATLINAEIFDLIARWKTAH